MSVINKMLQDLERRQVNGTATTVAALPSHTLQRSVFGSNKWLGVLLFVLGFASYQLLTYFWAVPERPLTVVAPVTTSPELTLSDDMPMVLSDGQQQDTRLEVAPLDTVALPADKILPVLQSDTKEELGASVEPSTLPPPELTLIRQEPQNTAESTKLEAQDVKPIIEQQTEQVSAAEHGQLAIEPSRPSMLEQQMTQAAALVAGGDLQQALAQLSATVSVHEYPEYQALRAAILQQQQNWPAALALYQQLLNVDPTHAGWNLAAGIAASQLGQQTLARQYYQQAYQQHQRLAPASQQFLQQQLNQMN